MKSLAIDTSSKICSVAILENDKIIKENSIKNGLTHSENFMPLVKKTLEDEKLNLNDINFISCVVGPGSFTGIRIGIASIKAIAQIKDIPVVSVTSLESLANNIKENYDVICSMIDAKNDQVYCGIFNNEKILIEEYIADDINNVIEILKKYKKICFVGDGAILHKKLLNDKLNQIYFNDNNDQNAESAGICGYKKYKTNKDIKNYNTINPIYLRKSQAERMKIKKEENND